MQEQMVAATQERKRHLVSEDSTVEPHEQQKRDSAYWERRKRNNEAAKRSRAKRRSNEQALEEKVVELYKENHVLRAQLKAIWEKHRISGENLVSVEQVLASLPSLEQVMRSKRTLSPAPAVDYQSPVCKKMKPLPALTPVAVTTSPSSHNRADEHQESVSEDSSSCSSGPWTRQTDNSSISNKAPEQISKNPQAVLPQSHASEAEDLHSLVLQLKSELEKMKRLIIRS